MTGLPKIATGLILVAGLLGACSFALQPGDEAPVPSGTARTATAEVDTVDQMGPGMGGGTQIPGMRGATQMPGIGGPTQLPGLGGQPGTPGAGPGAGAGMGMMGVAAQGAALYMLDCGPCHGVDGQGVDAPPLRNSQYVQTAGDPAMLATIAEGRPGTEMPAWLVSLGGPLTMVQIGDVAAYLQTMQGISTQLTPTGEPGPAASLAGTAAQGRPAFGLDCAFCHGPEGVQGLPNPGSDDGSVPLLDPIDPAIASSSAQAFAHHVDLYLEHGSMPEGSGPLLAMPAFGDRHMLSEQQIADLLAYVLELNGTNPSP